MLVTAILLSSFCTIFFFNSQDAASCNITVNGEKTGQLLGKPSNTGDQAMLKRVFGICVVCIRYGKSLASQQLSRFFYQYLQHLMKATAKCFGSRQLHLLFRCSLFTVWHETRWEWVWQWCINHHWSNFLWMSRTTLPTDTHTSNIHQSHAVLSSLFV